MSTSIFTSSPYPDDNTLIIPIGEVVSEIRISKQYGQFRIDMVNAGGITSKVVAFPDDKSDAKDERIKSLEARLEAVREAGGWYLDPGYFDDDD